MRARPSLAPPRPTPRWRPGVASHGRLASSGGGGPHSSRPSLSGRFRGAPGGSHSHRHAMAAAATPQRALAPATVPEGWPMRCEACGFGSASATPWAGEGASTAVQRTGSCGSVAAAAARWICVRNPGTRASGRGHGAGGLRFETTGSAARSTRSAPLRARGIAAFASATSRPAARLLHMLRHCVPSRNALR